MFGDSRYTLATILKTLRIVKRSITSFPPPKNRLHWLHGSYRLITLKEFSNTFFGYYDKSPLCPNNSNYIIYHANNAPASRNPNPCIPTRIILHDISKDSYSVIGETYSWNWQQGSRLHWLNGSRIVYNIYEMESDTYRARITDVHNGEVIVKQFPVQDSYQDRYYLSLSYCRLNKFCSDYGYRNKRGDCEETDTAIFYCDYETDKYEKIVDIESAIQMINADNCASISNAYFNHLLISPSGDKFIFLLRHGDGKSKKHYLFMYGIKDRLMNLLISNQIISHYTWMNNNEVLFWGIVNGVGGYFIVDTNFAKISTTLIHLPDGHPSIKSDSLIYTDTYPDKKCIRRFYVADISTGITKLLAEVYEPPIYQKETRCDLHPTTASIDINISGSRTLCLHHE